MHRTVEIVITDEIREEVDVRDERFQAAIGYLSLWAIGGDLPKVRITLAEWEGNQSGVTYAYMESHYQKLNGSEQLGKWETKFVMGAVFRDGKWEFHS